MASIAEKGCQALVEIILKIRSLKATNGKPFTDMPGSVSKFKI
jgi:hypothetical protein